MAARTTARELGRRRRRSVVARAAATSAVYLTAAGAALVGAAPFLWGLITAFEQDTGPGHRIVPGQAPTTEHVRFLFRSTPFPAFVVNTLVVGGLTVIITLALALPAAYALTRLNRSWGAPMRTAVVLVYLVPSSLLFLPLSRMVATLGLTNSPWSLVLVYPTITVPAAVWLLTVFMNAVPVDIEEQALVDGHSRAGAFARVVVPLLLPGIAVIIVLSFLLTAGEFMYALTFVSPLSGMPVSTGVPARAAGADPHVWRSLQFGVVCVAVPLALAANVVLDHVVAAFATGAADS